jgi:CubicO group peptidase (beta-lactamase class C family)
MRGFVTRLEVCSNLVGNHEQSLTGHTAIVGNFKQYLYMRNHFLLFCFLSFINSVCGQQSLPWKHTSPEDQEMNSNILINGIEHLKNENKNVHSLLVIKNNHLVLDAYFYPFQRNFVHDLASVTKSVTALLIGIAIDKGFIKDDNQPVYQYFPEYTIKSDTLFKLKIKDLLNMASGFKCSWYNGEKELQQMNNSQDWVKFMFSLPFESVPGTKFSYCSGNFYLLAEILQRTTHMTCHDFAKKYLFQPLDFGETYWEQNYKGVNHGWGDLFMTTYDMAKIGSLILKDGKWNDKQIISKGWLDKIKPLYTIQGSESYGYGWWLDSENPDEIQAVGRGGQRLFIFKNRDIIIATTGGGFEAGDLDNLILESIDVFDKNENHSLQLDSLVKLIQHPNPDINTVKNYLTSNILNKDFQLDKNELNLKTIRFENRNKEYYIIITFTDRSKEEHLIGMNNEYLVSNGGLFNLPKALKGSWDNDRLIIYYNELCGINLLKLDFIFSDTSLDLKINDLTDGWTISLKGTL